jgi:hypothetical protein
VTQFQTKVPVHLIICQPSKLDWRESIRYSTDFKFTRPQGQTKYLAVFLKEMAAEVSHILHLFFQASIYQGILPTDWKTVNVVPIFKKGEKKQSRELSPRKPDISGV